MDPTIIAALIPLAEKMFSGLAGGLGEASPGQKNALSELIGGLLGKAGGGSAASSAPQPALQAGTDSQILQALQALAEGHRIELDMTLKVRPKEA